MRLTRPSPAMLVAVVSLIAATAGDAIAGIARDVVGKDQVTSRSVKDRSLLSRDFTRSAQQSLKRQRGVPGEKGERGADARATLLRRTAQVGAPAAGYGHPTCLECNYPRPTSGVAKCEPGEVAVGGGVDVDDAIVEDLNATNPTADGTGWAAAITNNDVTRAHGFVISVLCVRGLPG